MWFELDAPMKRILATQVALDRAGFSPGEIDARMSGNTERALRAFQQAHYLHVTGELDRQTIRALGTAFLHPVKQYVVTADDVLDSAAYTSVEEMLADRFHTSAPLLRYMNNKVYLAEGDAIVVPNVDEAAAPVRTVKGELVVVTVAERAHILSVQNARGEVIFHAPLSTADDRDSISVQPIYLPEAKSKLAPFGEIRLTSWDASRLASLVTGDARVIVR